jgi:hypothetical protein
MSRFVAILLLLVFLVGAGVCAVVVIRLLQPAVTTTASAEPILMVASGENARQATEAYFDTALPPAPVTDQFYFARKQEDYWIRFNVRPDELHGLLAASPRLVCDDLDLLDGLRPEFSYIELTLEEQSALTWWTPDSANQFVGSDCVGENLTAYKMLVDTSNSSVWTVYMEITTPPAW